MFTFWTGRPTTHVKHAIEKLACIWGWWLTGWLTIMFIILLLFFISRIIYICIHVQLPSTSRTIKDGDWNKGRVCIVLSDICLSTINCFQSRGQESSEFPMSPNTLQNHNSHPPQLQVSQSRVICTKKLTRIFITTTESNTLVFAAIPSATSSG